MCTCRSKKNSTKQNKKRRLFSMFTLIKLCVTLKHNKYMLSMISNISYSIDIQGKPKCRWCNATHIHKGGAEHLHAITVWLQILLFGRQSQLVFKMSILCKHRKRNSCLTILILLKIKVSKAGVSPNCFVLSRVMMMMMMTMMMIIIPLFNNNSSRMYVFHQIWGSSEPHIQR